MTWIIASLAFFAGTFIGFLGASIFAVGGRADDYETIEHDEPRVMPKIWQGKVE